MKQLLPILFLLCITTLLAACGKQNIPPLTTNPSVDSEENVEPQTPNPSSNGDTVLTAAVTPNQTQTLYLWEEDKMSCPREYGDGYFDPPGFRPTITTVPVAEGVEVKGAVLLCAGGAFQFRGNEWDCFPTAQKWAGNALWWTTACGPIARRKEPLTWPVQCGSSASTQKNTVLIPRILPW